MLLVTSSHDVFLCEELTMLSKDDVIAGTFSAPPSSPEGLIHTDNLT